MRIKLIFKYILYVVLIVVAGAESFAQSDYSSVTLRIRNPQCAFGVADTNANAAYIFEGHKQYQVSFIDTLGKEEKTYIINKSNKRKRDEIIGGSNSENSFTVYFYNKKQNLFSSVLLDKATGKYDYKDLKQLESKDQFLRAVLLDGKFYILSVLKQQNILNVHAVNNEGQVNSVSYNIEMPTFYASLTSYNDLLNEQPESAVGIETIRTRLNNNIKSAYPKKKLYYENNKLYFSFDEPNFTHLITIDLEQSKSYYKKLSFTLEEGNNSSLKRGNSFLYDNKLFRATISPNMMNISIIELDSISLVNSYNIFPEERISILNSPIVQEGGVSAVTSEERVLPKTRQFFQRVLNGNIAIAANRIDSGKVEVEVGSYEEIITRGPSTFGGPNFSMGVGMGIGMGMGMGSGMGYAPMGLYPSRGFYGYPGYYPFNNQTKRLRIVSFKTLLEDQEYQHVRGDVPMTLREKINNFIIENFKHDQPDLYTIMSLNEEKLLLGYHRKSKNKFEVKAFDKISKNVNSAQLQPD